MAGSVNPGPVRTLAGRAMVISAAVVAVAAGVSLAGGTVAEGASVGAGVAVGGLWVVVGMSTTWVETAARWVGLGAAPAVRSGPRVSSTTPKTRKPTPITARSETPRTASKLE